MQLGMPSTSVHPVAYRLLQQLACIVAFELVLIPFSTDVYGAASVTAGLLFVWTACSVHHNWLPFPVLTQETCNSLSARECQQVTSRSVHSCTLLACLTILQLVSLAWFFTGYCGCQCVGRQGTVESVSECMLDRVEILLIALSPSDTNTWAWSQAQGLVRC